MLRNQGVCIWCQYTSELFDDEYLPMGLPSLGLFWSRKQLADEDGEKKKQIL